MLVNSLGKNFSVTYWNPFLYSCIEMCYIVSVRQKPTRHQEVFSMNNVMKGIIILAVIIYIVSPIDIAPGPIDDILVLLMGIAASKSRKK